MDFIFPALYGLAGAAAGILLNICILKIPQGAYRRCKSKVICQYAAAGGLTTAVFLLCYAAYGPGVSSALMGIYGSLLIAAAFIDAQYMYIPDTIHLLILFLSVISLGSCQSPSLADRLAGALFSGGFLTLINLLSHGGVGWGDIKLFAASGLLIGAGPSMAAVFMGYVMAGLWYALPLMRGRVGPRTQVPMAPFFALSLIICGIWHGELYLWYMEMFQGGLF